MDILKRTENVCFLFKKNITNCRFEQAFEICFKRILTPCKFIRLTDYANQNILIDIKVLRVFSMRRGSGFKKIQKNSKNNFFWL